MPFSSGVPTLTAAQVANAADTSSTTTQTFTGTIQSLAGGGGTRGMVFASYNGTGLTEIGNNGGFATLGFGNGTAIDTTLYRSASGSLVTAANLQVAGIKANPVTSGALPTVALSSGIGAQILTTRDVFLVVPITYNGNAADATCLIELSPDNTTYSALATAREKIGAVNGDVRPIFLQVPAGWYVRLTVTNATIGTGTYY